MIPAPATRRERRRHCTVSLLSILVCILLASPALGEAEEPPPAPDDAGEAPAATAGTDPDDTGEPDGDAPPLPVIVVDEVTITATRSERSVLDVPGNVTVIDRDTIDQSGARNVP